MALPIHPKILLNRAIRQFQSTDAIESGDSAISVAAESILVGHRSFTRLLLFISIRYIDGADVSENCFRSVTPCFVPTR